MAPAASDRGHYTELVQQRAAGTPLPYLIGDIEFYGLSLTVTPAVLIPRPETELLVTLALERLSTLVNPRVVEVGTGSGCIAVTLAVRSPGLHLFATDLSAAALHIARQNARRHCVSGRIAWLQADLLTALRGPVDLIVSNPPYVAEAGGMSCPYRYVMSHEPRCSVALRASA